MTVQERLGLLIEMTKNKCIEWMEENTKGQLLFVDPIDKEEISAHYGATHAAAAFILMGEKNLGEKLLESILDRWEINSKLSGFHNDFNNFALCVIYEFLSDEYRERVKEIVLNTPDSNHDTVNWLPMRWEVNRKRYDWTSNDKYSKICEECRKKIKKATWSDGFIDDRLPLGLSFNLQYDVATVAGMQYLRTKKENIDISKELGALLAAEAPDGDINYLGRGTNQIFAWGMWAYLLASSGQEKVLERAIIYLEKHLPTTLENNNLMLNDISGKEKYMWWDYHYCSVYTAHLLMWLVLAQKEINKALVMPLKYSEGNSGIKIYRNETAFVVTFGGRKEYIAEKGPIICALWMKKYGMIVKGAFGAWQGAFGNKYIEPDVTLRNFMGFLKVETNNIKIKNYLINKFLRFFNVQYKEIVEPLFYMPEINLKDNKVEIVYRGLNCNSIMWNMPILCMKKYSKNRIKCFVDGKQVGIKNTQMLKNQYGWCEIYQSAKYQGDEWGIILE